MTRQPHPHTVELAASDRSVLEEAIVTLATVVVLLVAFGGAAATATTLGIGTAIGLIAAAAVGLAIAVAIPLGATALGRSLARRLEARETRRRRGPDPGPVRPATRPRGR
ncbi:hypothetical protein [Natrononativus amylolyticus]|uniref:hypothetical protein n=1 Tax=Natrononativus amylolyticus TaxID=2963434 RepID=UPI0020CFD0A0|nr:hypothetical protein [Natrononativus amylolyticus]